MIYGWLARFREGAFEALRAKPIPGRPPQLDAAQMRRIYRTVAGKNPMQLKFEFALWTRARIRQVIRERFGVRMTEVSVGRLLEKLGLTPQKPLRRAYQQDPESVERVGSRFLWKREKAYSSGALRTWEGSVLSPNPEEYAMQRMTEYRGENKDQVQPKSLAEALDQAIRGRLRDLIETILEDELSVALGAVASERTQERRGYRNGCRERTLTCQAGTTSFTVPRARMFEASGETSEYRSRFLPHYERRTSAVKKTLLGASVLGTSTRKVRKALSPLWKGGPLSKSSVSRLAPKLRAPLDAFCERDLSQRRWIYVYLDAIALRVRLAGKVVSVPVMVALGVDTDGEKELLALSLRSSEGTAAWEAVCADLRDRGVSDPELLMIDGSKGLRAAVETVWPHSAIQRCMVHKLRNLLTHAPAHARDEVKADYLTIVDAVNESSARKAWARFVRKWKKSLHGVVQSLEEGGDELLTFYRYPKSQWLSLRTTNIIERLNEEFRRRVKVQGSLPDAPCAVSLLHALWADGAISMRRIRGYRDITQVIAKHLDRTGHDKAA